MVSQHTVQFFGATDTAFLHELAAYVSGGLELGEPVVVITERSRKEALHRVLQTRGAEPEMGAEDGRLIVLEGERVLSAISSDNRRHIDGRRFDAVIGCMMRDIVGRSRSRRVRAYGDMVGTLWKDGRREMAVELERYWNDLQSQVPFDLYCGYPIDVFSDEFHPANVNSLICQHTKVVPQGRNADLQGALDFALYETFGRHLTGVGPPGLPSAEATILWIREYLPAQAPEILRRARHYAVSEV
jgi:hypothetical protein